MPAATSVSERPAAIRVDLGAIFVSMELSRSKWLITSLSPGGGEKMSKHVVAGGDLAGLLDLFAALQAKARTGHSYRTIVLQEAGLDGFWIHRALEKEGIESHVVDPASITTSRRKKRAKTDRIDDEALVRALLAYKRGESAKATGSRGCCSRKGSASMSRCAGTDGRGLRRCARATAASCRRT
jgi:transposase